MPTAVRTAPRKGASKVKVENRGPSRNGGRPAGSSKKASAKNRHAVLDLSNRKYWLFAVDPSKYHWDTLFVKGKELWAGVKNVKAQRALKQVRRGDFAICYHGAPEKSIYALATVASDPYPDPTQPDTKNCAVDLKAVQRVPQTMSLADLRKDRILRRMKFLSQTRLPICRMTETEYDEILRHTGVTPVSYF